MRFTIAKIILAVGLFVAIPCVAHPLNTETLLANCKTQKSSLYWNNCAGYITGITDKMYAIGLQKTVTALGVQPRPQDGICPGDDTPDVSVTVPIFIKWADDQSTSFRTLTPAVFGVSRALQSKWPCKGYVPPPG
jgi:hypothetical protein